MKKTDTIVFLGPSLSRKDAEAILPNAAFLPPARCGDVIRVLRLKPKVIALVDGFFENTAAVWHKEILLALEQGVQVYGASSMGALRASELYQFGMNGIGKIFEAYKSAAINDDDEVAVLHAPSKSAYISLSDAMINIRFTLDAALKAKVIDEKFYNEFLKTAKERPYAKRIIKEIEVEGRESFLDWLEADGYVDQKKLDAIELLSFLRDNKLPNDSEKKELVTVNRSLFVRNLLNEVSCRPFHCDVDWLPDSENILLKIRLLGSHYKLLRRLSYFWLSVCAVAHNRLPKDYLNGWNIDSAVNFLQSKFGEEEALKSFISVLKSNDAGFQDRLLLGVKFMKWQDENRPIVDDDVKLFANLEEFILALMRLNGDYAKYKSVAILKDEAPFLYELLFWSALFWQILDQELVRFKLLPSQNLGQDFVDKFRVQHKLLTKESMMGWLKENELDMNSASLLFTRASILTFVTLQGHLDTIFAWPDNDCSNCWLLDVARFTSCYDMVQNRDQFEKLIDKDLVKDDSSAFAMDFVSGYNEYLEFCEQIN